MKHLIIDILLAPILGIILGLLVLTIVGYVNWRREKKKR